jgi:branched-chain amino acid transport system permease protein
MQAGTILQPLIYGLQVGAVYVLVALGMTVIFSMMNVMNFAHGQFYMFGAFCIFYLASEWGINYFASLLITMVVIAILGVLSERLLFRQAAGDVISSTILAIGLMWVLQSSAQLLFGTSARGMAGTFSGTVTFLSINISISRLMATGFCVVLVILLYFFMYKTRLGKAMQAVAQDRRAAVLQGINVNRINALGFAIGCALAGAAGGLMAPILYIDPGMGGDALMKSLSVIVLGGLGSIPGAVLGGLILGIAESFGTTFIGYPAATFPFAIILLVLMIRRTGLMGIPQ